jgi:hypothetical protein
VSEGAVRGDAVRFDELLTFFARDPRIRLPEGGRGFGSNALRVDGKIFAMFVRGRLPMKEWLSLHPVSTVSWAALAQEALEFVGPG